MEGSGFDLPYLQFPGQNGKNIETCLQVPGVWVEKRPERSEISSKNIGHGTGNFHPMDVLLF